LAITAPNAILENTLIYNFCDFFEVQKQSKITNFFIQINDKGLLGQITKIRLKQIQTQEWLSENPLIDWPYDKIEKRHTKFFLHSMITLCQQHEISFNINPSLNNRITGGKYHIRQILGNLTKNDITSLRNQQIMFLEQLTSLNGKILLEWKHIRRRNFADFPSLKAPSWYEKIKTKFLDPLNTMITIPNDYCVPATTMKGYEIKPIIMNNNKQDWVGVWHPQANQTILGKIVKKWTTNNTITLEHWIEHNATSTIQNPTLIRCPGCAINNPYYNHVERSKTYSYNCTNLYYMHDAVEIQKERDPKSHDRNTKIIYRFDTPLYDINQRAEFHSKFYNGIIPHQIDHDNFTRKQNILKRFIERVLYRKNSMQYNIPLEIQHILIFTLTAR